MLLHAFSVRVLCSDHHHFKLGRYKYSFLRRVFFSVVWPNGSVADAWAKFGFTLRETIAAVLLTTLELAAVPFWKLLGAHYVYDLLMRYGFARKVEEIWLYVFDVVV